MLALLFVSGLLSLSEHEAAEPDADEEKPFLNAVGLRGGYVHLRNREREGHENAPHTDDLGGFVISYERILVGEWLMFEVAKPFYFGPGRFDSPLEAFLKFAYRTGPFEPYIGVGTTFNIRVFKGEREEQEGTANDLSFGIASTIGAAFWIDRRWGLEVEAGYSWIPLGAVVAHEISTAFGPVVAF